MKCLRVVLLIASLYHTAYAGSFNFGSFTSTLKAAGNALIRPLQGLAINGGTLATAKNSALEGSNYTFNAGNLQQTNGTNAAVSGKLNPVANTFAVVDQRINASAGRIGQTVRVAGKNSILEGFTSAFTNPNTIILDDAATVLNIALISPLSTSIFLNNGTIKLISDLKVSGSSTIFGHGTILYNARTLTFDGTARTFGSRIHMNQATDLVFDGKVTLTGEWVFTGTGVIAGMGNILDISQGGTIRIKAGSQVTLTGLKLKGLGLGKILFDHPSSRLRLTSVEVEMNRNYTFTTGGVYAEGPTTIVTKDHQLTFALAGSLTVDGIGLNYDTLTFLDQQNITPISSAQDPDMVNLTLLNNGVIRHLVADVAGDIHLTNNTIINGLLVIHPARRLFLDATLTLSGRSNIILFANAHEDIVFVAAGSAAKTVDTVLQYFSPSFVNYGAGSALIFGDQTKIVLAKNEDLNTTWTFEGNCVLNGEDHILNLKSLGKIVVNKKGSSLLLENLTIQGLVGTNIRCLDNSCTISFNNVRWLQDSDFSFTTGRFAVVSQLVMTGSSKFLLNTSKQSNIAADAMLTLESGLTFSYDPRTNQRNLLALDAASSVLFMNGATLASTRTGLQLTKGQLMIDHKNFLRNDGAVSVSQSITLGDGIAADDVLVRLLPGGNINTLSGQLVYNNAS